MAATSGKLKRLVSPHPIFFDWLNGEKTETILEKVQAALKDFSPYQTNKAIFHKLREERTPWDYIHETKIEWLYPSEIIREKIFNNRKGGDLADRILYGVVIPKKEKAESYKKFCQDHLIPGEENFNKVLNDLNIWRTKHKAIFEKLLKNKKIGEQKEQIELISAYNKKNLVSFIEPERFRLEIKYEKNSYESLIEWVEVNYLLQPLLDKNEEFFSAIKKCEICSNFYFAYTNKAKYCSAKCKTAAYRQNKARLSSE